MKDKLLKKLDKSTLLKIAKRHDIKHSRQANKRILIAYIWTQISYNNIIKTLKEVQNEEKK